MSLEIERKFLVKDQSYRKLASGILYCQGYLVQIPQSGFVQLAIVAI